MTFIRKTPWHGYLYAACRADQARAKRSGGSADGAVVPVDLRGHHAQRMKRLRCRLEFGGHASLRLGQQAAFSAFTDVGSGFRPTPHGFLSGSGCTAIAIWITHNTDSDVFRPRLPRPSALLAVPWQSD